MRTATNTRNAPAPNLDNLAQHADDAVRLLKALSNRSRLMVLCLLTEGEQSVGELLERIPLSQSALSQHLATLRRDGIVATRRESQNVYYSLRDDRAARVVGLVHEMFCPD